VTLATGRNEAPFINARRIGLPAAAGGQRDKRLVRPDCFNPELAVEGDHPCRIRSASADALIASPRMSVEPWGDNFAMIALMPP
jgi:hypothetical protein